MIACAENIARNARNLMALTLSKCDFLISLFMGNNNHFLNEVALLQDAKEKKIRLVQNIYFSNTIYMGSFNPIPCLQHTHLKSIAR